MISKTIDAIHKEILAAIDSGYQKTAGFPTWDLTRAFSLGLQKVWDFAAEVYNDQDVDNLTGDYLTKFVFQRRGIVRKEANAATGTIRIVSGSGTITDGDLFATAGNIQFMAMETKTVTVGDTVTVKAVNAGTTGNVAAGSITKMPVTISGIAEIVNDAATSDGYDQENDDDLRKRYYEALQEPVTSGNVYHYKAWAKSISGVGDAKVIGCWNGKNTVKVLLIDSDRLPAGSELVERVQTYIDPGITGTGLGEAPIGAYCTVVSATNFPVNVTLSTTLATGYTQEQAVQAIKTAITSYLASIAFVKDSVSYAKIGALIIDLSCITDYDGLTINDVQTKLAIANDAVATLGTVTVNVNA